MRNLRFQSRLSLVLAMLLAPVVAQPAEAEARVETETYTYSSISKAQAKAAELQAEGYQTELETEYRSRDLLVLQIRVFQDWNSAKRVERKLKRNDIDALVVNDSVERGYAVSVGAYAVRPPLERQRKRVEALGYRSTSVVPVRARVKRHIVTARRSVAELPPHAIVETPAAAADEPTPFEEPPTAQAESTVLVFGGKGGGVTSYEYRGGADLALEQRERPFEFHRRGMRLEAGQLTDDESVNGSHYGHAELGARWRPHERWEMQAGVHLDGYIQTGEPDFTDLDVDYGENFVRYRGDNSRITAGTQTVIWGRVDEIPPTDQMGVHDVRRYILDPLPERRLPVAAVRGEWFSGPYKLDVLAIPDFRPAELPDRDSIWSPIDRRRGRFLGVEYDPNLAEFLRWGTFTEDDDGAGGVGARLSSTGRGWDWAVTVQRAKRSLPYYSLDEQSRLTFLATGDAAAAIAAASGSTFTAKHPWNTVIGADVGRSFGRTLWRLEAAWLSDVPITREDLSFDTTEGVEWVVGTEFFLERTDARINLQLAGQHLLDAGDVLNKENLYNFNGEIEDVFARGRWRGTARFAFGLNERDIYFNPELAFLGWEPHELYLAYHYFDGEDGTFNGYHEDHDLVTLGWRASF